MFSATPTTQIVKTTSSSELKLKRRGSIDSKMTDRGIGKIEATEQALFTASKETDVNVQSNGGNMLTGNADCLTPPQLMRSHTTKTQKTQVLSLQTFDQGEKDQIFMENLREKRKKLISETPKRQQLFYIFHLIMNQRKFTYNTCNALAYYFRCFACRKASSLKNIKAA